MHRYMYTHYTYTGTHTHTCHLHAYAQRQVFTHHTHAHTRYGCTHVHTRTHPHLCRQQCSHEQHPCLTFGHLVENHVNQDVGSTPARAVTVNRRRESERTSTRMSMFSWASGQSFLILTWGWESKGNDVLEGGREEGGQGNTHTHTHIHVHQASHV